MEDVETVARARALLTRILPPKRTAEVLDGLRAVSGPITMLKLHMAAGASKLSIADGAMTGFYVVDDRGHAIGELVLWIEDGLPTTLEYAWYTEQPPKALPEPDRVVSEPPDR